MPGSQPVSSRFQRILEEALQLADDERAELAARLLDSVGESPEEVERAWIAEAERRYTEFERGEVQTLPWAEVRKRVFDR
jgi:putative addiction module component (TIGR02574 family)